ncbi:MAG: hypothetical protein LWY06_04540 [Firmicutes bacterium]|nr:hypothetical protein [Bacillota bacterium]
MKSFDKIAVKRLKVIRTITVLALILIFPFMAEFTFRAFSKNSDDLIKPHPFLLWKFAPDMSDRELKFGSSTCRIDTNSEGLRNEKVDSARNERSFRILCVGDETTLGAGVKQSDTWAKLLQNLIRTRFHFFITEVINAGGIGYSSLQGVELVKEYCARYKPEIIVVAFLHNDYALELKPDSGRIPETPSARRIAGILYNSRIYLYLRNLFYGSIGSPGNLSDEYRVNARVSPGQFRENLEKIASIARSNGAAVIYLNLQPRLADKEPAVYRKILRDVAEKNGLFLDVSQDFAKNQQLYLPGGIIPNEEGHKLIAGRMFELVSYANLMPRQKNMPQGQMQNRFPPDADNANKPNAEKQSGVPEGKSAGGVETKPREKGIQQKSDEPGKPGNPPGSDDFYF